MLNHNLFQSRSFAFLEELFKELDALNVEFPKHWHIDHLCYRTSSLQNYQELQKQISEFATLMVESPVNGRNISTYALKAPVCFRGHYISHLELPEPKTGSPYQEGLEHIEMVCDQPLDILPTLYPSLNWKTQRRIKPYNDELACLFKSGVIKFHHQALSSVVSIEKQHVVFHALLDSKVLEDLRQFNPIVVGTFPVDIQTPSSDIDILISNPSLQDVEECLLRLYSHISQFRMETSYVFGQRTVVVQFLWKTVPFEIFAQQTLSFAQNGYRHFQVEERLLKIGGTAFKKKILSLREKGLKTEPAFAEALSLQGDPFYAVAALFPLSDEDLAAHLR